MDSMELPPNFDAWHQPIDLLFPDGSNFTVNMQDFNFIRLYAARLSIVNGAQIGATLILILVLLLLTRSEKRKSSIFIINAACLLFNLIRCILASSFTTSTLQHPYAQLIQDFTRVTKVDLATMVAANTFTMIVTILIMVSLSMQVWVVCVTTAPIHRTMIMFSTTIVALVAIAWKGVYCIINIRETLAHRSTQAFGWALQGSYITQAAAICLYSFIFTYKLGHAIHQRRKLKMPKFGPMQIVFIMGCQTMIIPGTFALFPLLPPTHLHIYTNPTQQYSPSSNSAPKSPNLAPSPPPSYAFSYPSALSGPASPTRPFPQRPDQTRTIASSKESFIAALPRRLAARR